MRNEIYTTVFKMWANPKHALLTTLVLLMVSSSRSTTLMIAMAISFGVELGKSTGIGWNGQLGSISGFPRSGGAKGLWTFNRGYDCKSRNINETQNE